MKHLAQFTCMALMSVGLAAGCAGGPQEREEDFATSGSREADQRADQRMAKAQQLAGSENAGGEKTAESGAELATEKKTLHDRLGGEAGIKAIVDDLVPRWLADPQVNFEREGIKVGGLSFRRNESVGWEANASNVELVKKNLAQFISLKTGGPVQYDGPDFGTLAEDKKVTNAEFDAAVGDLKATLDKLKIANQEQEELIALMESTRPQIVTVR